MKPISTSLRKIEMYNRHRMIEDQMANGGPGPIEESYRILKQVMKHQAEIDKAFKMGYEMGLTQNPKGEQA